MVDNIEYQELESQEGGDGKSVLQKPDIEMCSHVNANAEVIACSVSITLGELFSMKLGDVLSANEDVSALMTLVVDGKAVAAGNLVSIDGKFGFEIVELAK